MSNYRATINGEEFLVEVEPINEIECCIPSSSDGADFCFQAAKAEYDYCSQRAEKLESKVSILLAASALLFSLFPTVMESICSFKFPKTVLDIGLIVLYVLSLTIFLLSFMFTFIRLLMLLIGKKLHRLDPAILHEKGLFDEDASVAAKYIGLDYSKFAASNNDLIEKKYNEFNVCVVTFSCSMISLIIAAVICVFLSKGV